MLRFIKRFTLVEWLASAAILSVTIALLIPKAKAKWTSSGDRPVAVRVHVFDAEENVPLYGVQVVLISRGCRSVANPPPLRLDAETLALLPPQAMAKTGDDGDAVVSAVFGTSASNRRPAGHVHVQSGWVIVSADGYAAAAVPIRYESVPISQVRDRELPLTVGLFKRR